MSLIGDENRFIDVTAHGVRSDPAASRGSAIVRPGDGLTTNRQAFKNAIQALKDIAPPAARPRGTLFVPPGRYLIEADQTPLTNWSFNLQVRGSKVDEETAARQRYRISENRFGVSLLFPADITLWLAPGAVLVPARGCIVDIQSLLVCDATECFDLDPRLEGEQVVGRGGLVIFGDGVPVVRPEWWGDADGDDASPAIQSAFDAAIHDRTISWPGPPGVQVSPTVWNSTDHYLARPPLVVELRGLYRLKRTVSVRGDAPINGILRQLNPNSLVSGGRATKPRAAFDTATVIRGSWGGSRRQGAALVGGAGLGETPLMRLTSTPGITVENLVFSSFRKLGYQPCVELRASSLVSNDGDESAAQYIGFRSCRFEGSSAPLVQVGPRVVLDDTGSPTVVPLARSDNWTSDLSLLSFEGCEFRVVLGGIGVAVRAANSFPVRFRRCDFTGQAVAMLSLWGGTQYLEGCRFDNVQEPSPAETLPKGSSLRGYEPPDGSDVFLHVALPIPDSRLPGGRAPRATDLLPGFTAVGCVSRSRRFLSTVTPTPLHAQQQDWPVVLLNLRHTAPAGPQTWPSVRWGLQNHHSRPILPSKDRDRRRMDRGAPLVVIGGSFSGPILFLRGAVQGAVVGARVRVPGRDDVQTPGVHFDIPRGPRSPLPLTIVYGLRFDQRFARFE